MKIFTATAAMVPTDWREAVSLPRHSVQADVIIVAASKAAAIEVLVSGGSSRGMAESVVKQSKLSKGPHSNAVRNMLAAGLLDTNEASAFVYHGSQSSNPIARVDILGLPVVAHFRYREFRASQASGLPSGLYVEAVQP